MSVCVYDNPDSCERECWQDGKLIRSYNMKLFFLKDGIPPENLFFGANIGGWKDYQLVGDRKAMSGFRDSSGRR